MKHKNIVSTVIIGVILVVLSLTFSSCATSVSVRHMVPAEINLSSYRNLAIQSVIPYKFDIFSVPSTFIKDMTGTAPVRIYSGFNTFNERDIAQYATDEVIKALRRTNYFSLLTPPASDIGAVRLQSLSAMGYDAVLRFTISRMGIEEYIFGKQVTVTLPPVGENEKGEKVTELQYNVMQKATVSVTAQIIDTKSERILFNRIFSDQIERSYKIEKTDEKVLFAPSLQPWFQQMVSGFIQTIEKEIAPRWVTSSVPLMTNKPEVKRVSDAYDAVKSGNLSVALTIFEREWRRSKHVPSGYNAALIMESLGRSRDAISLMESVYVHSGNRTVETQLRRMRRALEAHQEAQMQL